MRGAAPCSPPRRSAPIRLTLPITARKWAEPTAAARPDGPGLPTNGTGEAGSCRGSARALRSALGQTCPPRFQSAAQPLGTSGRGAAALSSWGRRPIASADQGGRSLTRRPHHRQGRTGRYGHRVLASLASAGCGAPGGGGAALDIRLGLNPWSCAGVRRPCRVSGGSGPPEVASDHRARRAVAAPCP